MDSGARGGAFPRALTELPDDEVAEDGRRFRCTGRVMHFSWWAVDKPQTTGCLNTSAILEHGERFKVLKTAMSLETCRPKAPEPGEAGGCPGPAGSGDEGTPTDAAGSGTGDAGVELERDTDFLDRSRQERSSHRWVHPVAIMPPQEDRPESLCRLVGMCFPRCDECYGKTCSTSNQCAQATCDGATGNCGENTTAFNNVKRDDGNGCTDGDVCWEGACGPQAYTAAGTACTLEDGGAGKYDGGGTCKAEATQ